MSTSRPFAYNPVPPNSAISGTTQFGDLAIGVLDEPYADNYGGVTWWNGPDEDLGYVIALPVSGNTQPTSVPSSLNLFLNPSYKGTDIVITNGNKTATQIFGYQQSVLGTQVITSSDVIMYSVVITSASTNNTGVVVGFGTTLMNYGSTYGAYPGNDNQSFGFAGDGNSYFNGAVVQSGLPTFGAVNDVISVICRGTSFYVRVNGGYWNGSPSANPSTNIGGVSVAGWGSITSWYPAICPWGFAAQGAMTILDRAVSSFPCGSCYSVPAGVTFLGNLTASVKFYRSAGFTDQSFVDVVNCIPGHSPFTTSGDSLSWLCANGYWTNYGVCPPNCAFGASFTEKSGPIPTPTPTPTPTVFYEYVLAFSNTSKLDACSNYPGSALNVWSTTSSFAPGMALYYYANFNNPVSGYAWVVNGSDAFFISGNIVGSSDGPCPP
jgi:hypothetical protein